MLITNIADLRQQIHDDLRRQHPEWVLPKGESPMCDAYEARLMDLLALVSGSETTTDRKATHRRLDRRRDDLSTRPDFVNVHFS
jgi:hypothetical protein